MADSGNATGLIKEGNVVESDLALQMSQLFPVGSLSGIVRFGNYLENVLQGGFHGMKAKDLGVELLDMRLKPVEKDGGR